MRYYEIYRTILTIKHDKFNKEVRYKAFNNGTTKFVTDERKREMLNEQKKFIVALRAQMTKEGAYSALAEYKDYKMTIVPSMKSESEYLLVFFDKKVDEIESTKLGIDEEKELLYLEIEEKEE